MSRLICALVLLIALGLTPSPAAAHPLGPPPEVTLAAEGNQVRMTWRAERDDLYAIALSRDAVAGQRIFEEVNGEVVQVGGQQDDLILAESSAIPDYFTGALVVTQDGLRCAAEMTTRPTYAGDPGVLVHTCADPVTAVEVTITALTEFSDAYRTIVRAEGADPARGLHTAEAATLPYAFTPAPDGRATPSGSSGPGVVAGGVAAATVAAVLGVRRVRRAGRGQEVRG